ncbi:zinc-binding dehydrogenase [Saccharopolyspora taberi]|uniref:Zinc-binding dehydrogenase n=1 Tax=Saccharopolyspora taberi TaxID=60895 RepID=A0ABN3VEM9_9PSEU
MHAIVQHTFGPAETLRYEQVADPHPGPGQVRIAVAASGVHLVDTAIRRGEPGPFPRPELPMTPGREVAGVVDELGEGVDPVWLGRRVVAHLGPASGGYAELAVREVEALHELPGAVGFEAAVAMIGTGRTTMSILRQAELTADDVVVVTSAAGGIGNLAVQHAHSIGATVVGAASGSKLEHVTAAGADIAADYTRDDWPDQVRQALDGRDVTAVLDGAGGAPGRAAFDLLGAGGRIVLFGRPFGERAFTTDDLIARALTATVALGPNLLRVPGGMRALEEESMAALAEGRLAPLVGPPFPLAEAAAAHTALEDRRTFGKLVLRP